MSLHFRTPYQRVNSTAHQRQASYGSQGYDADEFDHVGGDLSSAGGDVHQYNPTATVDPSYHPAYNGDPIELDAMPAHHDDRDTAADVQSLSSTRLAHDKSFDDRSRDSFAPKTHMWDSIWLQPSVLVSFALLAIAMMLSVVLLYHFGQTNDGLGTQVQAHHYGWTYGPTAVLIIVTALWHQVEFAAKTLQPWQQLQKGPSTAEKTVLLDYVSPILPVMFYKAIRNRHWIVVASALGAALLKLTTVFSTGLLVLEPTSVLQNNVALALNNKLDSSTFDIFTLYEEPAAAVSGQYAYGFLAQGLQYPTGTGPDLVVQDFAPVTPVPADSTYSARVLGFQSKFDCDIIDIPKANISARSLPWYSILAEFFVANITHGGCSIQNAILAESANHEYYESYTATENFQGRISNYTCNDGVDSSIYPGYRVDHSDYPDQRVLLTMTDLTWRWIREPGEPVEASEAANYTVSGVTALLCTPSFTIGNYDVTYSNLNNGSQNAVDATQVSTGNNATALSEFGSLSVGKFAGALVLAFEEMRMGLGGADYILTDTVPNFFQVLAGVNNASRQEPFMDGELMLNLGTSVWNAAAAQFARQYLMVPNQDTVMGSLSYTQDRLQVKLVSTILMCSFLGLLAVLSIFILAFRARGAVPRDPNSIASAAMILAASPSFARLVQGLGYSADGWIDKVAETHLFRTRTTRNSFEIEPVDRPSSAHITSTKSGKVRSGPRWWIPPATTRWFLLLSALLSLLAIVILAVLQHLSDSRDGIMDVAQSGSAQSHVLANYLPAAAMLAIATMFASIENTASIFAPFSVLKRGNASSGVVATNLIGKAPPHAFYLSLKARNIPHLITVVAGLVAATLTIVVSGLYTVTTVPITSLATLTNVDAFDFTQGELSLDDSNAGAITSLIEYANLTYPGWTYDSLVMNQLDAAYSPVKNGSVNLVVPAYRAKLNCSTIPSNAWDLSVEYEPASTGEEAYYVITAYTNVPNICSRMPSNASSSFQWNQTFYQLPGVNASYVGQASLLQWIPDPEIDMGTGPYINGNGGHNDHETGGVQISIDSPISTGGYGCPTFGYSMGTLYSETVGNKTAFRLDMNTAYCFQNLEEVQTNLTLDAVDLSIIETSPPVTDESTSMLVYNETADSPRWEWPVNAFLITLSSLVNSTIAGPNGSDPDVNLLDEFTQTMVAGKEPTNITNLLGGDNMDAFVAAGQRLYSEYMAQAISTNMRNKTKLAEKTYQGQLTNYEVWRLKQNLGPALALIVMLAVLAVSAIAALLLRDAIGVLPHNPCSIAGTAALLAGSDLCARKFVPEGAEWLSTMEMKRAGIFEGVKFRMGWTRKGADGSPDTSYYGAGGGDTEVLGTTKGDWFGIVAEEVKRV